jgi:RimJ/RimL family protein N-acetyltransferase
VAEIDTLWTRDDRGRLVAGTSADSGAAPLLVIAVAKDGRTAAVGGAVPDDVAAVLVALVGPAPGPPDLSEPPVSLVRCDELLTKAFGPVRRSSGPSYVIEGAPILDIAAPAVITRSDGRIIDALRSLVPREENWPADEWTALLDGAFGPWAIVTVGDRVASVCHTPRLTDRGAEAGIWTDPDFRRLGYAAAATAAWASVMYDSGRHLFYSTWADNVASQGVAARVGARPIGWLWQLHRGP